METVTFPPIAGEEKTKLIFTDESMLNLKWPKSKR